jgi:hypothetical protein
MWVDEVLKRKLLANSRRGLVTEVHSIQTLAWVHILKFPPWPIVGNWLILRDAVTSVAG